MVICRPSDANRLIEQVVKECENDGCPISDAYATEFLELYRWRADRAAAAAKTEIKDRKPVTPLERREQTNHAQTGERHLIEGHRICYEHENSLAINRLGRNVRDTVLAYLENGERMFTDLEQQVSTASASPPTSTPSTRLRMLIATGGRARKVNWDRNA
jgi:hypothetical protein